MNTSSSDGSGFSASNYIAAGTNTEGPIARPSANATNNVVNASTGGGSSHSHSMSGSATATFTGTAINLAVKYVDVIRATKN